MAKISAHGKYALAEARVRLAGESGPVEHVFVLRSDAVILRRIRWPGRYYTGHYTIAARWQKGPQDKLIEKFINAVHRWAEKRGGEVIKADRYRRYQYQAPLQWRLALQRAR